MPSQDFDTRYYDIRQVSWDSYIEVRSNRYSVPSEYCGQPVTIRISLIGELSVYDIGGQLLAQHILHAATEGLSALDRHGPSQSPENDAETAAGETCAGGIFMGALYSAFTFSLLALVLDIS